MKNILKRTCAVIFAACIMCMAASTAVFASGDDVAVSSDSSGNVFGAGQDISISAAGYDKIDNELFLAGMNLSANDVDIDGCAFIAGNSLTIKDSYIGGSLFTAGANISIDSSVKNNVWAAGSTIVVSDNTTAKGINIAGANITVAGEYEGATLCGDTVSFNGKVDGDLNIEAEHVTIGEDAEVTGTLTVTSYVEPEIASGASVDDYKFVEMKKDENDEKVSAGAVGKAATGAVFLAKIGKIIKNILKYAVLALLFAFVFSKNLTDAYDYSKNKPGEFWGFGALALICAPVVAIILCVTVVGLPVAGVSMTIYALALSVSRVFAFASLVRELIFTRTKSRLHPILETELAVLPAAIIKAIPLVGGLVGFACAIYTIGYIVLAVAKAVSERNTKKQETVAAETETVAAETETVAAEAETVSAEAVESAASEDTSEN